MSKIKLSFSFLLMLILVGMFSIVSLAAAPTAVTKIKGTATLDERIDLTWTAPAGATGYNVYIDGTKLNTTELTTPAFTVVPTKHKTATLLEIEAVNTDGTIKTDFPWNAVLKGTIDAKDREAEAIINANKTGEGTGGTTDHFNQVIKSTDQVVTDKDGKVVTGSTTHKTHGEYQNNTNSCASCHQTHTASSKNLLFKNGEYATCTSCHDGTLGFYDVFTGSDSAGTFGGTHDGNMSVHLATGAVAVKAAPGGNRESEDENWEAEFTCASCHAPHGSYSDRLLHYNPNDMGNLTADEGGKRLEDIPVVSDYNLANVATKTNGDFFLNKFTLDATSVLKADYAAVGNDAKGKKLEAGDTVYQLMRWDPTAKDAASHTVPQYVEDKDPWLHGYEFDNTHTKLYWTTFLGSNGKSIMNTDSITKGDIYFGKGFVGIKADNIGTTAGKFDLAGVTKVNISRAYVVSLDTTLNTTLASKAGYPLYDTNVKSLWTAANVWSKDNKTHSGEGVKMSQWCTSCHTDYFAYSAGGRKEGVAAGDHSWDTPTGTFEKAYRHSTNSDSYTCVRCHFAHGTDVTIMKDAQGKKVSDIVAATTTYFPEVKDVAARQTLATDYMLDKDPSSALKRFTNMSVCWGCHTSSHSEGTRNGNTLVNGSGKGGSLDTIGLQGGN